MEEWKIKQEIYHRLNKEYDDDLSTKKVEISNDIIGYAVQYFNDTEIGFIYPAKSYMVAICYARWLAEDYGGRPIEYLDDPDLLYNNDPYYVVYSEDSKTYIQILNEIGGWDFDESKGLVPDVRKYYEAECGL